MTITIDHLTKRFGKFVALDGVSLELPAGQLTALLGPSGSGKTTLLRCIAGLERPDSGSIHFDGNDATKASPAERNVGFVFQHYALFRHMTVGDNVAFGLQVRPRHTRPDPAEIAKRVKKLLELIQLDWAAGRYPHQLSGGQRQRVALARALAVEPKVLLLDEPFGALDAQVRKELRRWLRRLHDEVHLTSVFVTHDQEEALEVSDRVVVFNQGRVEQIGTPEEVYHAPATPFVHTFLGTVNVLSGEGVHTYVRPHDVHIVNAPDAEHPIPATIRSLHAAGPAVRVELVRTGDDTPIEAVIHHSDRVRLGLTAGLPVFIGFTRSAAYHGTGKTADYAI
jgi:sulfate transport system ATP-binding protein